MKRTGVLGLCLLLVVGRPAFAQAPVPTAGGITGVVTAAESGQPLSGASVRVAGTRLGAVTGSDGRYTIAEVPAGRVTVQVSFLGYGTAERTITVAGGETATVDMSLSVQALALGNVVVVGYATQRRQDVTGSVAALQRANMENLPIRGATEALAGQIPGVSVLTSTGAPGSGAQVQVRGVSAIGAGATPLYVVDGFPITASTADGARGFTTRSPLADIPPSEIESITVLKDASAAAIYGSQASNGVVIITTRRGAASQRARIDIQAYAGVQTVDWERFPKIANATEFATFQNRRWRQLNPNKPLSEMPEEWRDPAKYGEGTNWYRQVMRSAPTSALNVSLSGGSERVRAFLSMGYLNQDGIVLGSQYRRFNARANIDAHITDRLRLGFILAPTFSLRHLPEEGGQARAGGFGSTIHAWPTDSPYDKDGNLKKLVWGWVDGATLRNPINVLRETVHDERALTMMAASHLDFQLRDGVQLRSSLNLNRWDVQTDYFLPSTLWSATGPAIPEGRFITDQSLSLLNENTINVDRRLGDAHQFQLLGGFTAQYTTAEGGNFRGQDYPSDDIQTLNAAGTITTQTSEAQWSLLSLFGRVNYSLLDRYVLTASLRTDGSSRFGAANRWGTFPSAAIAWNVSRERFMQNVNAIQDVKLRLSHGFTGNNQIGNFSSLGRAARANYVFGGSQVGGTRIEALENPDLGWERTREWNVGLEASFLNRGVTLVADAYRRITQDLVLSLELPTASGFGSVIANRGSIQNTGFEVGLNTRNVDRGRFRWNTNFNVSVNRNKALDLGASDTLLSGASMEQVNTHITVVGQPIGRFYGYRIIGIYTPADIADPTVAKYAGAVAGDVKFKDVNGDGVIRQREDFEVIGTPWPRFTWGMTNTIEYGPLLLRAIVDGQVGGQRLNRNLATIENIDGPFNVSKRYVETMFISWDSIGDGKTPAAGSSSAAGRRAFRDVNDRWVEDADFVWIRNVQLSCNLPQRLTRVLGSSRASVYASISNPYIFTRFSGNPQTEANQALTAQGSPSSPSLSPGVDNFTYPLARIWTLGINLGL